MAQVTRESWKETKLNYLETCYGKYVWKYDRGYGDDRQVLVNVYRMMVEAIESLPDNPNNYVCCAINAHMDEDVEMMQRIIRHFEDEPQWFDKQF